MEVGQKFDSIVMRSFSIGASQGEESHEIKKVCTEPPPSVRAAWTWEDSFLLWNGECLVRYFIL